jgi:predicted DNA-binding transcriptional regulator AlpA
MKDTQIAFGKKCKTGGNVAWKRKEVDVETTSK